MKKSVMKKWVKALRSGKYKQARSILKDQDGRYCCLGVLCHISKLGKFEQAAYMGRTGLLHGDVMDFAGMSYVSGRFTSRNGKETSLAALNDNGKTFPQIADYIEKYWEQL